MATAEEKARLYALDLSGVKWVSAPNSPPEGRVEAAFLEGGCVALRNSDDPDTVLRYTEKEWTAFTLGCKDGEFDV